MAPEIVPATSAHAERLSASLSEESRRGLTALGEQPLPAILDGLRDSEISRALLIDGEVMMVGGVVRRDWGGQLWFLTSDVVLRAPRAFLSGARAIFAELGQGYSVLANFSHARNERTLRLAEHFDFKPGLPFELNGHPFIPLVWEAPLVHGG